MEQQKALWLDRNDRKLASCSLRLWFSRSVMSDSLWPHGLQHTRLPCPSPSLPASGSFPLGRKVMTNLNSAIKSRDITLLTKVHIVKAMIFSSSHVWMLRVRPQRRLSAEELMFQAVVLEKTFESPLNSKVIKSLNPKGNQPWIYIGRTDAEAEALILWPSDAKSWLIGKTLIVGTTEGRRRRGNREWDGWMASSNQWTWVWADSGR